jgi:hypothetical protein
MNKTLARLACILPVVCVCACYYAGESTPILLTQVKQRGPRGEYRGVRGPCKVHLKDYSTVVLPEGYRVVGNSLNGKGTRYFLDGKDQSSNSISVVLDSIAAVTSYFPSLNSRANAAWAVLGITGIPMSIIGYYCAACPKCCFGSCPTVYTVQGGDTVLSAELFSHAIASTLESSDIDRLAASVEGGKPWAVKITDEALETHWLNKFQLLTVRHRASEIVLPRGKDSLLIAWDVSPPLTMFSAAGTDVRAALAACDSSHYRTGASPPNVKEDWVEVVFPTPSERDSVALVVRTRNTLLSTVLLYDVVLGSQGIDAVAWTERMNTDSAYAARFRYLYEFFSGVRVQQFTSDGWKESGRICDAGPLAWRQAAIVVPVAPSQSVQRIRLCFYPDNQLIDMVGVAAGYRQPQQQDVIVLCPLRITDGTGREHPELAYLIAEADSLYVETNPGDVYWLRYHLPDSPIPLAVFARSQGHYTEWVRAAWIARSDQGEYRFNLDDVPAVLAQLTTRWEKCRGEIEEQFFQSRIPVREDHQ